MTSTESEQLALDTGPHASVARRAVYLHPGELVATGEPSAIKTILGSCIAVCLWDSDRGIGGMNHYVLSKGVATAANAGRIGSCAIPRLIEAMVERGARVPRLQAKLFGGASMVTGVVPRANQVGAQNLSLANELLARASIPVVACDVGGARGRKIVFHTDDGSVSVWTL